MQFPAEFPAEFPRPMPFVGDPFAAAFRPGDIGGLIGPWSRASLSQDTAGATPVTAGDPVGRAYSRFGGGYHPVQSTALSKPLYKVDGNGAGYLEFDGTNDSMASATMPWGTAQATFIAVLRRRSDVFQTIMRVGYNSGPGGCVLQGVETVSAALRAPVMIARGTGNALVSGPLVSSVPAPQSVTLIARQNNTDGTASLYQNGVLLASGSGQGSAVIGNDAITFGTWFGNGYAAMDLYGAFWINREMAVAESFRLARRMTALARFAPW